MTALAGYIMSYWISRY